MEELKKKKNMNSTPPVKAPKYQLAIEQPLTEEC